MKRLILLCYLSLFCLSGLLAQSFVQRTFTPNGRVFDLDRKGDTLYAVGSFTYVGVETGGGGWLTAEDSLPPWPLTSYPVIEGSVRAVTPDGSGGWYVGGDFDQVGGITCNNLVHIFPGGTVDQNFLPDINNEVKALAIFNDTIMIGGRFTQIDGIERERLAAFDLSNGQLTSWDPGTNNTVNALAVVDGTLMVGGQFTRIGGRYQPGMARLSIQEGQMLPTLSPALGTVHSFTLDGQKLYTAGSFNSQVGRFTGRGAAFQGQDASPMVNFPRFNGTIRTIKEDGNGGWYVGGDFFQVDGQNISRLAHILPNGTVDPAFSLSLNSSVYDLMIFNDTMMIAGSFQSILGQTRRRLAAIQVSTGALLDWDPDADNTVTSLETDGTYIFVGGVFSSIGGRQQAKLAILDKQTGVPLQTPSPVSGQVNSLAWNDTMMFAGGSFTGANGLAASRLTLLSDNATIPSPTFPTFNNTVYDIEPDGNGGWYVAGAFTQVNGNTLRRLAHILPDSTVDPNFDFNINNAIYDIAIFNDTMMIAGAFTSINGTSQERIAAVNLINDTLFTWNPGVNGIIRSIQKVGTTLYMGGNFTDVGGQVRNRGAAVDIPTGNVLPWDPDFNNTIYQLAWNDTMMIAMGSFTNVGGQTRNRLAALDPISALPLSWDPNVNNQIRGGSIDGNLLYIGGLFTQVGGQSRSRLAAVDLATGAVQAWDPGASSTVETISIEGNVLYVGGGFTQVAGQDRQRAAAFDLPGGGLRSWAPDASATVYTFGTQGNQVMIGGSFTALQAENRNYLMALDRSDFARSPWAPTPNGTINDLKVFNDTILLAGTFTSLDGQPRSRLAMVNDANTPTVLPWDPGADATVRGLHVFNDTILVAGNFSQLGGQDRSFLGAVTISSGQPLDWNPQPNHDAYTVNRVGGVTMAGGAFDTYESEGRSRVLCLDLSADSLTAWHPGISGFGAPQAYDIALSNAGIWVGGSFGTIGDSARQNLALTDPITGQVLPIDVPADDRVYALEIVGDSLWVGGNFDSLQGQFRAKLGVIHSSTGVPFAYQPNANDDTRFLAWNDTMMVVGGDFSHLIGRERRGGYAVDTKTGQLTPWNPDLGLNDFISTMEIDEKNGDIYLGGSFDEVGGLPRENLARVDANTGLVDSSWQADGGFLMYDLAWDPREEQLYVAGNFTEIGGQPRNYLARLNADGSVDSWDPSPDAQVRDLAWNDTMMFAAGSFTNIAGVNRDGIAAIQINGQASDWNPEVTGLFGLSGDVSAIAVSADRIYLGGSFRQINGASRDRLAAFDRASGELLPWRVPVDSSLISTNIGINQIRLRDENLFVSGLFSEINGTQTDNFAWIDAKSGLAQGLRTNINNLVFDVEVLDSLVYLGGDFFDAENTYTPNIATYRVGSPEFQEKPVSLQPKVGGNNGDVTVHIFGSGFTTYPTVILRKAGLDDVVAIDSLTRIFFGNQIRATFNLRNAPLGLRDVWIIGNGDTTIVEDGFRVVQGREPRVYANLINPRRIRYNPTSPGHTLRISYGNAGSIDAEGVPIWLALSSNLTLADIQIEFLDYPSNIPPGDSILPFVPIDTLNGEAVDLVVYCMVLGRVPAGFQGNIGFRIKPDTLGKFFMTTWATKPLFGSPLKYAVGECTDAIIGKIVGLVPGGDCIYNGLDAILSPIFDAALDPDFGSAQYAANYAWTLGGAIVDCGIVATGGGLVLDILKDILNYKSMINDFQSILACIEQFSPDPGDDEIEITTSVDPNQKVGLPGVGIPQWINPVEPLPYLVEFENLPTATAPAIEVRIEDTLDVSVMDLSTFELKFFTLADSIFEIPPGRTEWKQMVDLRPTGNHAFARVSLELDTLTGIFFSRFEGLDPATLELLDGADEGIIPPNVNDPEGRGSVGYRVDLLPGLPTLTPVANSAAIYFDFNAPIITNTWINTLDVDAPESEVTALDPVQNTLSFPVSWSGSDLGSGIKSYDVYVSTDGGPFLPEIPGQIDTVVNFTGEAGRSYAFYSIAIDSVGNEELAPAMADASTTIDMAASTEVGISARVQVIPNPNQGQFEVVLEGLGAGSASLRLLDMAGRVLLQQQVEIRVEETRIPVLAELPAGVYLLGIQTAGRYWHQRVVIE